MNTYYIDITDQSIKTNIGYGDIKLPSMIAYTSVLDLQNIIIPNCIKIEKRMLVLFDG